MAVPSGLAQTKCCSCSRCSQPPRTPPQQPGTDGMLLAASSPAPSLPASFCLNDATSFVLLIEATDAPQTAMPMPKMPDASPFGGLPPATEDSAKTKLLFLRKTGTFYMGKMSGKIFCCFG
ncbi:uncharacterized protein ACIB01_014869 isoform 1-T1 [Guaruba guarouba]